MGQWAVYFIRCLWFDHYCIMIGNNHGRDISRGIISWQKSGWTGIGEGNQTRPEIQDMSGCPILSFPRFFPAILGRKKSREKGKNWEKSRKIGDNPDFSWLTSNFFKCQNGHLDLSRHFGENRDGHLHLSWSILMIRGGWKLPISSLGWDRGGLPDSPRP